MMVVVLRSSVFVALLGCNDCNDNSNNKTAWRSLANFVQMPIAKTLQHAVTTATQQRHSVNQRHHFCLTYSASCCCCHCSCCCCCCCCCWCCHCCCCGGLCSIAHCSQVQSRVFKHWATHNVLSRHPLTCHHVDQLLRIWSR